MPPGLRRQAVVVGVVLLHGLGLWALQSGLLGRAVERFTFVPVLAQLIEAPPAPDIPPAPHQVEPTPQPKHRSAAPLRPQPVQQPAPIADVLLAPPAAPTRLLSTAANAALMAQQRYRSGLIDFATVLETQRTQLSAQDSVATTVASVAADHVRLYKALGGGWQ